MCEGFWPTVRFDGGTLRRFFENPETALADPERFWDSELPMQYVLKWHADAQVPVSASQDWFRKGAEKITSLPPAERASHRGVCLGTAILEAELTFVRHGLHLVRSLLPRDPVTPEINVYLVAYVSPYVFTDSGFVVIDATSPHWFENESTTQKRASWILNILVHELWHRGYRENPRRVPIAPDDAAGRLLETLQNEGTATYVGHCAQALFSAADDLDYAALDDSRRVREHLATVNAILARVGVDDSETLSKLAWERGIAGRAFYVGGAHMARAIDRALGREVLNQTVADGPGAFVEVYNGVADHGLEILIPAASPRR